MDSKEDLIPLKSLRTSAGPTNLIPPVLIGKWSLNGAISEIRSDDRFYEYQTFAYSLTNAGNTLSWSGWTFSRLFGSTSDIVGVWEGVTSPGEELNLRSNGTFTWQVYPGGEYFGDYVYDPNNTTATTAEMRATISTSGSDMTFHPPYGLPINATWSVNEPYLTLDFSGTQYVYTRA